MTELYPYQIEGAHWLAEHRTALLADEMGLGKSAQAIVAAHAVGAETIGVICPASLRDNWAREFDKFWPDPKDVFAVWIESYDMVTRGAMAKAPPFDVLILDESHYLKSITAKRTRAIFRTGGLASCAERVWCLTGTPMPNNPSELWATLHALAPETIENANGKTYSYWPFVQKFCVLRHNGFGEEIVKGRNIPELRERIKPFVLRRRKGEVLPDLPPITVSTLPLTDTKAVDAMHKLIPLEDMNLVARVLADQGVEGLAKIAPHVATLRRVTGEAKVPVVCEWIADFLAQRSGEKLVVFAHHRAVLVAIRSFLVKHAIGVRLLWGDTKPSDRQLYVDDFQGKAEIRVFLGQTMAAGVGITLTAASTVLFAEPDWTPSVNTQAMMRIHRIGQENHCAVRFAALANSIDETIINVAAKKAADITALFD